MRKLCALLMWLCVACSADFPSDDDAIDPSCAAILCGWTSPPGQLVRAGSWHPEQGSLELVGESVTITRQLPGALNVSCFKAMFLADVDRSASLELQLDFNNDQVIDARAKVPATQWRPVTLSISAPFEYRSVTASLVKQGAGRVRIASLKLSYGSEWCGERTTLADGAQCSTDETCSSGRCVLGVCASCAATGCAEGAGCRTSEECADGACAAGVCRACAKTGSCATDSGCSLPGQCASSSCNFGDQPSTTRYPGLDGVCGECNSDSACPSGHCVRGRCSTCAVDSDCASGQTCRTAAGFDVGARSCMPLITSLVPRGGLCEQDSDCSGGLRCGAAEGRAKRCGIACLSERDCGGLSYVCATPGFTTAVRAPATLALLPAWSQVQNHVRTCYQTSFSNLACDVHEQCELVGSSISTACCNHKCLNAFLDTTTNTCIVNMPMTPDDGT